MTEKEGTLAITEKEGILAMTIIEGLAMTEEEGLAMTKGKNITSGDSLTLQSNCRLSQIDYNSFSASNETASSIRRMGISSFMG